MEQPYEVLNIIELTTITPEGEVAKIHKITALTGAGDRFTIDVPEADFVPGTVTELLRARARTLSDIRAGK